MTEYRATSEIPEIVRRALERAEELGFERSSAAEVGRLLRLLASQLRSGVVGEIGTGCGVGAAWIASGLAAGVSLVTIEADPERAEAARNLFRDYPNVSVLTGDWREIVPYGPFALLFADGGRAKNDEPDALLNCLAPRGLLVLDDLTPEEHWPAEWRGRPDPLRRLWLDNPRPDVIATEVLVTPRSSVILVTITG